MEATLNGASGHSAKIPVGDPWSTGPEPVLTPLPPMMGRHVLDNLTKRSWNAPLLVQLVLSTASGESGVRGPRALRRVEYLVGKFSKEVDRVIDLRL